ncbi:MAG: hypothetical protein ACK5IP_07570 [Paracoccus sp. (in: a-proteobacteria)]
MTQHQIARQIHAAKTSIMAGHASKAAENVEHLMHLLENHPPLPGDGDWLKPRLAELRHLAEAALAGTRAAAEEMQAILQAARSLETYDKGGQRKVADTATAQPRRF